MQDLLPSSQVFLAIASREIATIRESFALLTAKSVSVSYPLAMAMNAASPTHVHQISWLRRMLHLALVLGLAYAVLRVAMSTPWVGVSYMRDVHGSNDWRRTGIFGLDSSRSSLWDPPRPHSPSINASLRWPWQPVSQTGHIEVNLSKVIYESLKRFLLLGLIVGAIYRFFLANQPDVVLQVTWSLTLTELMTTLGLFVIVLLSAGFGPPAFVAYWALGVGVVVGLTLGLRSYRVSLRRRDSLSALVEQAPGAVDGTAETKVARKDGLLMFTLGMFVAAGMLLLAMSIASFFRGPVAGITELGTPRYARDQTPLQIATGVGIVALGWPLSVHFARRWGWRAFAWGLAVGSTLAGIVTACAK